MISFESITDPAVQKQLLEHSLQILNLSRGSRVRLLCHEARSAGQLLGLLRDHAPETLQDDHLLMLRGPFQDMVMPSSLPTDLLPHTDSCVASNGGPVFRASLCYVGESLSHHLWLLYYLASVCHCIALSANDSLMCSYLIHSGVPWYNICFTPRCSPEPQGDMQCRISRR